MALLSRVFRPGLAFSFRLKAPRHALSFRFKALEMGEAWTPGKTTWMG
jgi:hypothetical protein